MALLSESGCQTAKSKFNHNSFLGSNLTYARESDLEKSPEAGEQLQWFSLLISLRRHVEAGSKKSHQITFHDPDVIQQKKSVYTNESSMDSRMWYCHYWEGKLNADQIIYLIT